MMKKRGGNRMKILVVMPTDDNHKRRLKEAAPEAEFLFTDGSQVDEVTVKDADIIVGNVLPSYIKESKKLKLLQLNSAGTDGYTAPGILPEHALLTNATGAYGLAISEHMIGMLLSLMKRLNTYCDNMKEGKWADAGNVNSIYGSNTLVVGLGDIGNEFAVRMSALGSHVYGIKRRESEKPSYIEKMYRMDEIKEALRDADIVAAALPSTPETYKIFNKEIFNAMKRGTYFINVGRGTAVNTEALLEAVREGIIAGAGLDVTDPEPLPAEHPLWHTPGVLITPHVSGGYHLKQTHDRIIDIAARNIVHIINGEPVENLVDMKTGYRL